MLLAFLVAVITFTLVPETEGHNNPPTEVKEVVASTTSETKEVGEWKYPELKRICSCESTGSPNNEPRHFDADGSVLLGRINPNDIGQCQINTHYHRDAAEALNLDLWDEKDNKTYAEYLYENQGHQPWFWSNKCWNT